MFPTMEKKDVYTTKVVFSILNVPKTNHEFWSQQPVRNHEVATISLLNYFLTILRMSLDFLDVLAREDLHLYGVLYCCNGDGAVLLFIYYGTINSHALQF